MRLAHVSDPHFGAEVPDLVAALRTDLIAQDVDRILVSGDLTMRARPRQFREAKALLDAVGRPWTAVPGNHDVPLDRPDRLIRPLDAYRRDFDPQPEPAIRDGDLLLLGLSTARPYLWKGGRIDAAQIARIGAELTTPAPFKVLMLHHPVFRSAQRPGESLVYGAGPALHAAAVAGVDVVLCGHDHVAAQVDLATVWPGLPRHVIGLMSGTACSWRVRAGDSQSYTVLDLAGDRLRLHVRSWAGGEFRESSMTEWHRSADGWRR